MSKKVGLFPGSFDPFTKGHECIVEKALFLFDEIVIGIGVNSEKKYFFDLEKRIEHIKSLYANNPNVKVEQYSKLTVDFATEIGAKHIIRGLRNSNDFNYEQSIATMNFELTGVESVFFLTETTVSAINSTIVREIYRNGAKIDAFVTNASILV